MTVRLLLVFADACLEFEFEFEFIGVYVTCNDISVIYVTAQICRRTEEEVVPTVELSTP